MMKISFMFDRVGNSHWECLWNTEMWFIWKLCTYSMNDACVILYSIVVVTHGPHLPQEV